jgi:hypothetical protein
MEQFRQVMALVDWQNPMVGSGATLLALLCAYYGLQTGAQQHQGGKRPPRRMSFSSRTLIDGSFPAAAAVAEPIINVGMYFEKCPTVAAVTEIAAELSKVSRFRSSMVRGACGAYEFKEIPEGLDMKNHVIPIAVANEAEMRDRVTALVKEDFDGSDGVPLFRFVVLQNKGKGVSCLLFRVHHVVGDGLAMVGAMNRVFKDKSGVPVNINIAENMKGGKVDSDGAGGGVVTRALNALSIGVRAMTALGHVLSLGLSSSDSQTAMSKPSSSIKMEKEYRDIVLFPTMRLDFIKAVKKAAGATVNDVLLSVTGGAITRYCIARGETAPARVRALIPVAFPRSRDELDDPMRSMKNKWAFVSAQLPTSAPTAMGRLEDASKEMQIVKLSGRVVVQRWVQEVVLPHLPQFLARQTAYDIFSRHSMVFSNVPGPQTDIYMGGERMCGMQVLFPNLLNQTMIISYGGGVFMNMCIDPRLVPDPHALIDGFTQELRELASKLGLSCSDKDMFVQSSTSTLMGMV